MDVSDGDRFVSSPERADSPGTPEPHVHPLDRMGMLLHARHLQLQNQARLALTRLPTGSGPRHTIDAILGLGDAPAPNSPNSPHSPVSPVSLGAVESAGKRFYIYVLVQV